MAFRDFNRTAPIKGMSAGPQITLFPSQSMTSIRPEGRRELKKATNRLNDLSIKAEFTRD
jgi:hypothetical protein